MSFKLTRIDESRALMMAAASFALGVYVEQEAKKVDSWRDIDLGNLYEHLRHEILDEIRPNIKRGEMTYLIHNAADAAALSLMILARAIELNEKASRP